MNHLFPLIYLPTMTQVHQHTVYAVLSKALNCVICTYVRTYLSLLYWDLNLWLVGALEII